MQASTSIKVRLRALAELLVVAMLGTIPALLPATALLALFDFEKDSDAFMMAMLYAGSVGGSVVGMAFAKRRAARE
ncbi:MAG TPA: hypothetical protein VIP10_03675 [Burkholderiaceae bacterium]